MGTTTVTANVKKKGLMAYQCSNCGKVHLLCFDVLAQGQLMRMGNPSKSIKEQMGEEAKLAAAEQMPELEKELSENNFEHRQVPAFPCEKCGNIEPWMSLEEKKVKPLRLIVKISLAIGILMIFAMVVIGAINPMFNGGKLLIGPLVMFILQCVLSIVIRIIHKQETEKVLKAVQENSHGSLPLISFDPLEFVDAVKTRFANDPAALEEAEMIKNAFETTE